MYESYFCGTTFFSTVDEGGSAHSTHNFERNYSRSRLDSVGHEVSKHHFNFIQIASTPINRSDSK
jgi:3-dehydroquinate dehydratase